jgi:hypothetical protein
MSSIAGPIRDWSESSPLPGLREIVDDHRMLLVPVVWPDPSGGRGGLVAVFTVQLQAYFLQTSSVTISCAGMYW